MDHGKSKGKQEGKRKKKKMKMIEILKEIEKVQSQINFFIWTIVLVPFSY